MFVDYIDETMYMHITPEFEIDLETGRERIKVLLLSDFPICQDDYEEIYHYLGKSLEGIFDYCDHFKVWDLENNLALFRGVNGLRFEHADELCLYRCNDDDVFEVVFYVVD